MSPKLLWPARWMTTEETVLDRECRVLCSAEGVRTQCEASKWKNTNVIRSTGSLANDLLIGTLRLHSRVLSEQQSSVPLSLYVPERVDATPGILFYCYAIPNRKLVFCISYCNFYFYRCTTRMELPVGAYGVIDFICLQKIAKPRAISTHQPQPATLKARWRQITSHFSMKELGTMDNFFLVRNVRFLSRWIVRFVAKVYSGQRNLFELGPSV